MNIHTTIQNAPYWSELQIKLIFPMSSTAEEMNNLKKEVNAFCAQGTGFQSTIYHFIKNACKEHAIQQTTTKEMYDIVMSDISFICQHLDDYLKKHPRRKKTIHSIQDIGERYWKKR